MRSRACLLSALALCAASAAAAKEKTATAAGPAVLRGPLRVEVPFEGKAVPHQPLPAFAPHDGRIQSILVLPGQWVSEGEVLMVLVDKELGALLESEPTTPPEIVAKRWGKMYRPTEVRCPFSDGYIVSIQAKSHQHVRSGDPLMTIAPGLKVESDLPIGVSGGVPPQGATARAWSKDEPGNSLAAKVLEVRPAEGGRAGRASVLLPVRAKGFESGSPVEGRLVYTRQDVLKVPSRAVWREDGRTYLILELPLGVDNGEETELLSPVPTGTPLRLPPEQEER